MPGRTAYLFSSRKIQRANPIFSIYSEYILTVPWPIMGIL